MNSMFRTLAPALALLSLGAGAGASPEEPPLAGARIGGPFELVNQDGRTVRDSDFAGVNKIVYFGYTYCPDVCPNDMQKLGAAMRLLDKEAPRIAAKVQPIFVTVDPERDTPPVIKAFVGNFHPRFVGLTGSPEKIAEVTKNYAVYAKKQPPGPGGGYLVDHAAVAFLMDPDGKPITSLPIDKDPQAIAEEVRHWVR